MNKNNIKPCLKAVPVMGGHAACWVKAKPNAFSGEKENAKVKIHLCGGVETGASCQNRQLALAPVTGFVVSYNY